MKPMKRTVKILCAALSALLAALLLSGCVELAVLGTIGAAASLLKDTAEETTPAARLPMPENLPLPKGDSTDEGPRPMDEAPWVLRELWTRTNLARDEYGHGLVDLSAVTYTMPDTEALEEAIEALKAMVEEGKDAEGFLTLYTDTLVRYGEAETQMTMVSIVSDLNINDKQASADKVLLEGKINEYYDALIRLSETALDAEFGGEIAAAWGEEYAADVRREARLTCEELQPLIKEYAALKDEYDNLSTNLTVDVDGTPMTIEDIYNSSSLGLKYYSVLEKYYLALNEQAGALFLRMVKLNNESARIMGYDSFADYQYDCYNRDYTPADAASMAEAVKKYLVPLYVELQEDPPEAVENGYYASTSVEESISALQTVLPYISENMAEAADFMLDHHLYDFSGGSSKVDGGYTTGLTTLGVPYINYKPANGANNVTTVFHEFGHFYNSYKFPGDVWNKTTDLDLAEIHSQGLELLLQLYYGDIFGSEAEDIKAASLSDMIWTVLSGCMEDEFQRILYAENEDTLTVEKLNEIYGGLMDEYQLYAGSYLSDDLLKLLWVGIPHTFDVPFYYISYATSLVAALQIWELEQDNPEAAIKLYLKVQSHNADEPFKETLAECGMASPFEESTVRGITTVMTGYFNALRAAE